MEGHLGQSQGEKGTRSTAEELPSHGGKCREGAGQQFWALTQGGGVWPSRQWEVCAGCCVWFLSASEGLEWDEPGAESLV